jgi:diguanylate cyclase (GGDEF)-like protein
MKGITLKKSWRRSLLNSYTGISIGLIIAALLTIWQQTEVQKAREWVNHTFEVLNGIQNEQSLLLRLDFALQNYLLENSDTTLAQYKSTQLSVLSELNNLKQLTIDNPIQQNNLKTLQSLIDSRFELVDNEIVQPAIAKKKNNSELLNNYRSKLDLSPLKEQLAKMEAIEKDLLTQRRLTVNEQGNAITLTVVGTLLLAGILTWQTNRERERQKEKEKNLNIQLQFIEVEQDLSNHLLTCRTKEEAYEILHSFFQYLMPSCSGAVFEINNSRDQIRPTVIMGDFAVIDSYTPKDCWALRQGQMRAGERKIIAVPCQICKKIYSDSVPSEMLCLPLQAHEQTIGILHISNNRAIERDFLVSLTQQIALPLAVLHLQAELERQTFRDSSTGLWNRRFMDASVQRIFARAKRLSYDAQTQYSVGVIFCDVDHFKAYNSEFGHEAGDLVLRAVAKFLIETCREDDLPCRYGGEEFVLILPDTHLEGAKIKAEKIREGVKKLPAPGNRTITLSLGVSVYPQHGITPDEVLKAANLAMLRAKTEGRDRTLLA